MNKLIYNLNHKNSRFKHLIKIFTPQLQGHVSFVCNQYSWKSVGFHTWIAWQI